MTGRPAPVRPRGPSGRSRRSRPGLALIATFTLLGGMVACGADDASGPGEVVEGRAPDSSSAGSAPGSTGVTGPPPVPLTEVTVALTAVAELDSPTKLTSRPGSEVLYVAEQGGRVATLVTDGDDLVEGPTALDLTAVTLSGGEQGLLGLAFSPDGATLYVHHSGLDGATRVASYAMAGDVADPDTRTDLLELDQPYANHNGGELVVDGDGLLWIGLGDGGAGGDPDDRAQDPDDLLGKLLRIDPTVPTGDRPYSIPDDNPYAAGGGRPEIAVSGLRNPWRFRLDPATGDLWVADVGQDELEEIDHVPAADIPGTNLGWSRYEGSATYDEGRRIRGGEARGPVYEMHHDDGWCSVTGGPVYRGSAIPALAGAYLFGDYCKPGLAALRLAGGEVAETSVLDDTLTTVVSIDTDGAGEVYVVTRDGPIYRMSAA